MRRFATLLAFVYLGLTLGALAQHVAGKPGLNSPTWHTLVAALSFQGIAIVFTWRFVREHGLRWAEAFGFNNRWPMALLFGVLAAGIFLPIGMLLQTASAELMSRAHIKTEIQPAVQALQHTATWLDRVVMGVVAIGIAPVAEELLFRGILYPAIKQAGFPRVALWGTSLLFAGIHVNLGIFVPLLLLALVLAQLYERTGNLLAPIAAHVLFNALNFARFFYLEAHFNQPG
jgi:membrane protease YdiL (CAAX protease family)